MCRSGVSGSTLSALKTQSEAAVNEAVSPICYCLHVPRPTLWLRRWWANSLLGIDNMALAVSFNNSFLMFRGRIWIFNRELYTSMFYAVWCCRRDWKQADEIARTPTGKWLQKWIIFIAFIYSLIVGAWYERTRHSLWLNLIFVSTLQGCWSPDSKKRFVCHLEDK